MALDLKETEQDGVLVIKLSGVLDAGSRDALRDRLAEFTRAKDTPKAVMDMGELDYISSVGWSVFVENAAEMNDKRGGLKFACMRKNMDRLFQLMGINAQIESYAGVEQAVKSFSNPDKGG